MAGGAGLMLAGTASREASATDLAAAPRRVPLGGAIQAEYIDADPAYRQAFLDHCDLIMPMNELKLDQIRPTRDSWNFEPADRLVEFALANGRQSRGTCHVWWNAMPPWLEAIDDAREAEAVLIEHVERVTDRYRGRLVGWDVVNEVVANDPLQEGPLRRTDWLRKLGPRHIPIAFSAAARADPAARLVINDYDLEFVGPRFDARREVMLSIVRQMQDNRVAVHGVGMQGHLYADREIDIAGLERFHRELDRLGVGLLVTELDVIDWHSPADPERQDATAHRLVSDLLDAVFAWKPPEAIVVWGISDRYSWIPSVLPRPDGAPDRPLPLDRDMVPKNWMRLLDERLRRVS
jgi:endo-1,4-beta-xylanase